MAETLGPLIAAARAGDRRALETLAGCADRFLRIFHGSLSRNVRRARGSTIDFVLEGLGDALSRLSELEYRSDEEFYAWLGRSIQNRIIDAHRAEARQKRAVAPVALAGQESRVPARDPSPSQVITTEELRRAAGGALLEIQLDHPEEMEIVLLKVFEGRTWPEIKEALGLTSEKRARTLFARGIDLLRPRIEERLGEPAVSSLLGL
jgi:RNA polymerase sigma factor (sigma-70 family)